jgi:hypothetical protein
LASFGQQTLLGVYRWLILCLISFVLTHWVYLSFRRDNLPDWKEAALLTLHQQFEYGYIAGTDRIATKTQTDIVDQNINSIRKTISTFSENTITGNSTKIQVIGHQI